MASHARRFNTSPPASPLQLLHSTSRGMPRRRGASITDEEIAELVSKLQSALPESHRRNAGRMSAVKLLKETCSYIKSLHREVHDLSDRLAQLMASVDGDSPQAEIIRSLLRSS